MQLTGGLAEEGAEELGPRTVTLLCREARLEVATPWEIDVPLLGGSSRVSLPLLCIPPYSDIKPALWHLKPPEKTLEPRGWDLSARCLPRWPGAHLLRALGPHFQKHPYPQEPHQHPTGWVTRSVLIWEFWEGQSWRGGRG